MKNESIIIVGKSGSGKNFLLNGLIKKGMNYDCKLTTRPIRKGEKEGYDYHYIDNSEFLPLMENNQIKVYQKFIINNIDWYYGITKENFDNNNLFIMTPLEISQLSKEERKGCFVVYLDINDQTRRKRISKRNDNNDSVERRILSDNEDFKNFKDYDMLINDPKFDIDLVYDFTF